MIPPSITSDILRSLSTRRSHSSHRFMEYIYNLDESPVVVFFGKELNQKK